MFLKSFALELENGEAYLIFHDKHLGKGATGHVYEGGRIDQNGDYTQIAAKIIDKSFKEKYQFFQPDVYEMIQHSIEREAQILSKAQNINIVQLYHMDEDEQNYYLFLEYCDSTLLDYLEKQAPLNQNIQFLEECDCIDLLRQITNALFYLKKLKICHRDLKPENILMVGRQIKIADFGSAKVLENIINNTAYRGTHIYSPPEWFNSIIQDQQCQQFFQQQSQLTTVCEIGHYHDIWSLGIILYRMLYNKFPYDFKLDTLNLYKQIKDKNIQILPLDDNYRKVSGPIKELLVGLLQKDINNRFSLQHLTENRVIRGDYQIFQTSLLITNKTFISNENFYINNTQYLNIKDVEPYKTGSHKQRELTPQEIQTQIKQSQLRQSLKQINDYDLVVQDIICKVFDSRQYLLKILEKEQLKNDKDMQDYIIEIMCPIFYEYEVRLLNNLQNLEQNIPFKNKQFSLDLIKQYNRSLYYQNSKEFIKQRKKFLEQIKVKNNNYSNELQSLSDEQVFQIFEKSILHFKQYAMQLIKFDEKALLLLLIQISSFYNIEQLFDKNNIFELGKSFKNFQMQSIEQLQKIVFLRFRDRIV